MDAVIPYAARVIAYAKFLSLAQGLTVTSSRKT